MKYLNKHQRAQTTVYGLSYRNGMLKTREMQLSPVLYAALRNPVHMLNRAVAGIELKLFEEADSDATLALEQRSMMAKGYFRRGQARELMGILGEGAADFLEVDRLQPQEASIKAELVEVAADRAEGE